MPRKKRGGNQKHPGPRKSGLPGDSSQRVLKREGRRSGVLARGISLRGGGGGARPGFLPPPQEGKPFQQLGPSVTCTKRAPLRGKKRLFSFPTTFREKRETLSRAQEGERKNSIYHIEKRGYICRKGNRKEKKATSNGRAFSSPQKAPSPRCSKRGASPNTGKESIFSSRGSTPIRFYRKKDG